MPAIDISVLKSFGGVFPFLLVLVLVYAVLVRTDLFKEKVGLAGLIALFAAFMTLFSDVAIKTINLMTPWFVLFTIFAILFMLAFMMFGFGQSDITKFVAEGDWGVGTWVMAIMVIIGLGSLAFVLAEEGVFAGGPGANVSVEGAPAGQSDFWSSLFHPKILGMVLVLLIAYFTIGKMSSSS